MARGKYEQWLTEDGLLLLQGWARRGLTDEQIAHNCGVTAETLRVWQNRFSVISVALKKGKEVVDLMVENALLKRALGYTYEEVTRELQISGKDDDGKVKTELVETKRVTKEVVPDVTAQIYWLKNRRREDWKDSWDRAAIDRERLEIDKRVAEAQIDKMRREAEDAGQTQEVRVVFGNEGADGKRDGFDEEWSK